jgi:chorismate mutase/prephenate dehydratase
MSELVPALEHCLAELHRNLAAHAGEGIPAAVSGLLPDPSFSQPDLQPHLANAVRRLNEVIREQAFSQWWQADEDWELGRQIQAGMRHTQVVKSVAFLGKTGSHSHRSALSQYPDAVMLPVPSFTMACGMVLDGGTDAAVLPIDNSTAGTIAEVYDLLLRHDLHIARAASLSIRNVLLGVPGASVSDIREVWTHPQPILQCARVIAARGWKTVSMASTAVAADSVAQRNDRSIAAVGSREAALLYGLEVLEEGIDDADTNQTRFVTVMRALQIPRGASRVSLVFTVPHESGSLSSVMSRLADFNLNVVKIQSRPIPHRAWEYSFHLDFESRADSTNALMALYMLDHDLPYMKLLGWYAEDPNPY